MKIYLHFIFMQFCCIYQCTSSKIKLELKKNILNFGYGINYMHEGMLSHSFDRFYVLTKLILPSIGDLNFSDLSYNTCAYLDNKNICNTDTSKYLLDLIMFCQKIEPFVIYCKRLNRLYDNTAHKILKNEIDLILYSYNTCAYLDNKNICNTDTSKYLLDLIMFCQKIEPFVIYCKRLNRLYDNTAHKILKNEIDLILLQVQRKQKHGIITTLVSCFIGLTYDSILSFLHHK